MRRFCLGITVLLFAAAVRAEDAADQPVLVLNTGGHTAPIKRILFTPDGKEVVTVSVDKTVRLWDAATGERLAVLRAPVGPDNQGNWSAAALSCSPDGKTKTLAVGGGDYDRGGKPFHPIYLIDLVAGRVTRTLDQPNEVMALAFSHDGARLASGAVGGECGVWDAASGKRLLTWKGHTNQVRDLAFSPDDKLLASVSFDRTARLWSVATGKEAAAPMVHEDRVYSVAWKDDDTLATGGSGRTAIHLWDRTGKPLKHFDKPRPKPAIIYTLAFRPAGNELFYIWEDNGYSGAAFLNLAASEASRDGPTYDHGTTGDLSPDGKLAASVSGGETVSLWAVQDGKQVLRLAGRGLAPLQAGWASAGHVVGWSVGRKAGAGKDDVLQRSFDLDGLRFGARPDAQYLRASRRFDDLRLEPGGAGNTEVRRDEDLVAVLKTSGGFQSAAWLSGDRVALGTYSAIAVYNARTGVLLRTLKGFTSASHELAVSPDGRYLLGAFADKTLRVWDPDKEEPLLSLFVAGADWVAWTQEGYYAASPGGEKLMGWQVNNGLEQLGTFYPAAQFHKAFYRPDVIKRMLALGSVEKARAAADKESKQTTEAVSVAQALPPEVNILTPTAGKLNQAEVEVRAQARSKGRPVVTMHLLMDGRPCPGAEAVTFAGAKPGEKKEAVWKVTLPDGEHQLVALAETDASLGVSPDVVVTWQAAQEPLPILYVLAIGVNAYPGSLKLNWAVADASAIAKAFRDEGAPKPYGKVETKLLLDRDASKEGILAGLDWLKAKMTADDTAIVFYAGHGHRDKKTSQFYLLPQDVDVSDLPKTSVTGTQIKEKLRVVPGRVLVLLDACHSGSIGQSPADPGSLTDDVQRQLAAPDCGVVVMCAAMAQEEAGEAAAVKHGFFTAALLMGLGGAAPRSKDGLVHLTALNYYVEEEVAELSKDEQHVVVDRPATLTSFPLVKPPPKAGEK